MLSCLCIQTNLLTYFYLRNNLYICSQINSFAKKFPLVRKLKYQFEIPCKLIPDTADLRTPTQTLYVKGAPTQDVC